MRRNVWFPLAVLAVLVVLVSSAYWFQPWKAFTNQQVDEQLTLPYPAVEYSQEAPVLLPESSAEAAKPATDAAKVIAAGTFISHEHSTSGEVQIVQRSDGSRVLEIANLDTSNGPDLRVWLSDQPVIAGSAGWKVFAEGRHVELGKLKGNQGNQVYTIPAEVDLEELTSVSIWCKRFSVSFGAAALSV